VDVPGFPPSRFALSRPGVGLGSSQRVGAPWRPGMSGALDRQAEVRNLEKGSPSSRRGWHTHPMNALWLSLLFGAPWLAAIAYTWSRAPRRDGPPPSFAYRTRERLWA
jgi:hypothetical protein